jgi:hypothetical protein
MCMARRDPQITEVRKPNVGEAKPAGVTANVVIDTRQLRPDIKKGAPATAAAPRACAPTRRASLSRQPCPRPSSSSHARPPEWDELKQHDVMFLLTVRPPDAAALAAAHADGRTPNPGERFGLAYVRGCEVVEVRDEGGRCGPKGRGGGRRALGVSGPRAPLRRPRLTPTAHVRLMVRYAHFMPTSSCARHAHVMPTCRLLARLMNDFTGRVRREDAKPPEGFGRTLTVALDTAQYQIDMNSMQARIKAGQPAEDPYATFNLVVRCVAAARDGLSCSCPCGPASPWCLEQSR